MLVGQTIDEVIYCSKWQSCQRSLADMRLISNYVAQIGDQYHLNRYRKLH